MNKPGRLARRCNHTWQLYTSHQNSATSTVAQAAAQQHLQVLTAESYHRRLKPEVSRHSASTYTAGNTLGIASTMPCARPACSSARLRCWFQPNDQVSTRTCQQKLSNSSREAQGYTPTSKVLCRAEPRHGHHMPTHAKHCRSQPLRAVSTTLSNQHGVMPYGSNCDASYRTTRSITEHYITVTPCSSCTIHPDVRCSSWTAQNVLQARTNNKRRNYCKGWHAARHARASHNM